MGGIRNARVVFLNLTHGFLPLHLAIAAVMTVANAGGWLSFMLGLAANAPKAGRYALPCHSLISSTQSDPRRQRAKPAKRISCAAIWLPKSSPVSRFTARCSGVINT